MEEQIQMLIALSGQSYEKCKKVLEDAFYDADTAAVILLGDPGDLEIKDYDLDDENGNWDRKVSHRGRHVIHGDGEEVEEPEVVEVFQSTCRSSQNHRDQSEEEEVKFNEVINLEKSNRKDSIHDFSQNLLLIPYHRLQDLLEKVSIPETIEFKQIWTAEGIIPIPGGITICEISPIPSSTSSSHESEVEIQTFLSKLATSLLRYKMSTCFNIESITKKQSRVEFIKKMETLYSDILEVNSKRIQKEFHDHVIFHSSIVSDDTDVGVAGDREDIASHMSHVLTVTLTGLPELLLVMQDASQAIAASMSSSSANGNSLACVPNEWSLLCHTAPYALILLEPDSPEWNTVLENGKYVSLPCHFTSHFPSLPLHSAACRWSEKTVTSVVKCIHRIENIELWRCYCSKRDGIERLRGDANEKWYWHGTRGHSPEVIAREGFDFRVANPGSYGRGAYFAHSVNYSSNGYQHTIPGSYQVTEPAIASYSSSKSSKKRKAAASWSSALGTTPPQPFGNFGAPQALVPSMSANSSTTTVTNSVIRFPDGVGAGDHQLILARVCLGKTATSNVNGVSLSPSLFSWLTFSHLRVSQGLQLVSIL
jgi:hypothetical protein